MSVFNSSNSLTNILQGNMIEVDVLIDNYNYDPFISTSVKLSG